MTIFSDYLLLQIKYEKKYGKMTIVFMQVGSFHEAYGNETMVENLKKVAEIINVIFTRKDKSIKEINEKNPCMIGFPTVAKAKYIKFLIDYGYTVVIVDQSGIPPNITRNITGIYSLGTYIEHQTSPEANFIVTLYIENEKQLNGTELICVGMCALELTIGSVFIHEAHSLSLDSNFAFDEANLFISCYQPKEIIVYQKNNVDLIKLDIRDKIHHIYTKIPKEFEKIRYQNELLQKIFCPQTLLTPLEYFGLNTTPYSTMALILSLDYAHQHNSTILYRLGEPKKNNDQHLILGNNALIQLNVIESNYFENHHKFHSLFDVINHTLTAIGRRLLRYRLSFPFTSIEQLCPIYNSIDTCKEYLSDIELYLREIADLERLLRKILLKIIQPYDFADFIKSLNSCVDLMKIIIEHKILEIDESFVTEIKKIYKKYKKLFHLDELKNSNMNDIMYNIFKKGKFTEIDELNEQIKFGNDSINVIANYFSSFLNNQNDADAEKIQIKTKQNERDGHFFVLTKKRWQQIQTGLEKNKKKQIKLENICFNLDEIKCTQLKGTVKITLPHINQKSDEIIKLQEQIKDKIIAAYHKCTQEIIDQDYDKIKTLIKLIGNIDFIYSGAKCAKAYKYTKPSIHSQDYGSISAKQLRHPIIERIIDYSYVSHDVTLNQSGILLFGMNSCGKSSLMKAIGLSIILAQIGYFVPATEFTFSPYSALYARITGNDNLFRGLSSFTQEMVELRAILYRSNSKTLIIGDEPARGTEYISANSVVVATIAQLSKLNCSFVFATHLHEITDIPIIKNLKNLKIFHLVVEYDEKTDNLIFHRTLREGTGDPIYGVIIANYMIKNNEFMKLTKEVQNYLLHKTENQAIVNTKTSHYNNKLYVDKCSMCNAPYKIIDEVPNLDTHHIIHQEEFRENDRNINITKNQLSNLVVLCKKCHKKIHQENMEISGYVLTTKGKMLKC